MPRQFIMLPALLGGALSACTRQPYNLPVGVTETSQAIFDLHIFAFWVCAAIGVVVFGVIFFSIFFHRKSRGYMPATFSHSTKMEIVWTIIPILILIMLMVPATKTLMDMYEVGEPQLDVKITAYQWKWQYEYLNRRVDFFSNLATPRAQIINRQTKGENYLLEVDQPLVLPVNTRVRFLVTAADVLHSWWVPEFSVKKDAIPGFISEAWTEVKTIGTYRGQCTELCGTDHGFMPIVVEVVSQEDFDIWLAARRQETEREEQLELKTDWTKEELLARGEQIYAINCASCHQPNGRGVPPSFPALEGSSVVLGDSAAQIDILLNGRTGTAMAAFGSILGDNDLAAVISYTRNSWGNQGRTAQELIFPQDVRAAR